MNVVDFAEGILGIGESRNEVAKCLRETSGNYEPVISFRMMCLAKNLDRGDRTDLEDIRLIGEKPLADTQKLFLNAQKENSN